MGSAGTGRMNSLTSPLSLAEIEFYVTRAITGAGAPFGFAEASGRAIRNLAATDRVDWTAVADALDALGNNRSGTSTQSDLPLSALVAGPLQAWGVDDIRIHHNRDRTDLAKAIAATLREGDTAPPPDGGVVVPLAAWATVQTWFQLCLVPSSDESRLAGAGAGLVDTD